MGLCLTQLGRRWSTPGVALHNWAEVKMSKFIDKLEKVGLQLPTPLGFGTASKREEQPPAIMLVGKVTPDELAKTPGLADAKVDAFLVSLGSWDEKVFDIIGDALGDRICLNLG